MTYWKTLKTDFKTGPNNLLTIKVNLFLEILIISKSFPVRGTVRYVETLDRFLKAYIYFTRLEWTLGLVLRLVQHSLNRDRLTIKIFNNKVRLVIGIIFQNIFYFTFGLTMYLKYTPPSWEDCTSYLVEFERGHITCISQENVSKQ